jgi:cytochrome c oxidase subunit 1
MWGGRLQYTSAMLNAMAFVAMFIIGGLSGIFMAATPVDMHIHDTYFIVGHIHYVLFGGSMFALFAAIYHWFPKMFGRLMNERLGHVHFFLTFIFFNGTFFLMHIVGMHGMPRRYADYTLFQYLNNPSVIGMNRFMTYNALLLGATQLIFAFNFLYSLVAGPRATDNPWHSNSLEWATSSPPAHFNFLTIPTVYHGPYEYSVPGQPTDFLPQTEPRPASAGPIDPIMGDA